jgi:hypothetical protein
MVSPSAAKKFAEQNAIKNDVSNVVQHNVFNVDGKVIPARSRGVSKIIVPVRSVPTVLSGLVLQCGWITRSYHRLEEEEADQ